MVSGGNPNPSRRVRLNRFLAQAGLGSRRACEQLIVGGKVVLNRRPCRELAATVGPEDEVRVRGRILRPQAATHLALHKPRGFVTTASDELGRRTIFDLLPPGLPRLFHVGRLDKDSEGLLILTNDGALAQELTHPRHGIEKEYSVTLDKAWQPADRERLTKGIRIEGGRAVAEEVGEFGQRTLRIVLRQGIKRQIRLMLGALGYRVERLKRIRIGPVRLGTLPSGGHRPLSQREIAALRKPGDASGARPGEHRSAARGGAKRA